LRLTARPNTVLVADDFKAFRRVIQSKLKQNGFQNVAEASDGVEAVAKAADLHPSLIILDIGMPNLDGIKAAEQIRSVVPNVKILFLSQYSDPDIMQAALNAGAAGYVRKSEMDLQLLPAIEAVLRTKGLPR
jgi:DNA-binding NarL/FixJ family response regulator